MGTTSLSHETANHAKFIRMMLDGDKSSGTTIDEITLASWKRCREDYYLDPDKGPEPTIIERPDLEHRLEDYCRLLDIARPEMSNLYQQLAGSGHAIMLTDREGVLLNYIGDPRFTDAAARAGMQIGAVWSELAQGTNGMGTCLVERKPLVIHKRSHFFTHNIRLTCAAAPVFDPHGEILAVLDASSESRMAQQHTMVLLNMSAQVIENRAFFCAMRDVFVVRFHSRAEFISTLGEGAIAFDPDGKVVAINRSAMFQIGLEAPAQIVGKPVEQVFSTSVSKLMNHALEQGFRPFPIRDSEHGRRFFASVQPPHNASPVLPARLLRRQPPCIDDNYLRNIDSLNALHFGDARMKRNIDTVSKLLERDIPCMLFGETGTGKEMFARAIHRASSRRDKPFIAINCASLPESLIESELFGYRPGAFTGASRDGSRGKIVQADGGTLFLDEIGDMPIHLQARLLRVLEEREVSPLGGEKPIKVSLRLISATHHNIQKLVEKGEFREDLFYRLHGISLTMPPLRERNDKLALIRKIALLESEACQEPEWDSEALKVLEDYSWPGNIRQLRNVLRAVTALCEGNKISLYDLPDDIRNASSQLKTDGSGQAFNALAVAERDALLHELEETHWNISRVAKKLGLSRNTLYRRMKRYEINPPR